MRNILVFSQFTTVLEDIGKELSQTKRIYHIAI